MASHVPWGVRLRWLCCRVLRASRSHTQLFLGRPVILTNFPPKSAPSLILSITRLPLSSPTGWRPALRCHLTAGQVSGGGCHCLQSLWLAVRPLPFWAASPFPSQLLQGRGNSLS